MQAARNCVVTDNMVVKVGDYGISPQLFSGDYLVVRLPLRVLQG